MNNQTFAWTLFLVAMTRPAILFVIGAGALILGLMALADSRGGRSPGSTLCAVLLLPLGVTLLGVLL